MTALELVDIAVAVPLAIITCCIHAYCAARAREARMRRDAECVHKCCGGAAC